MKTMTIKTAELIRKRIKKMTVGEPFTPPTFLAYGTRASVDQTLSRLVKAGFIERVTRGVFVRPEVSRFVGKVMPEPLKVAQTIAKMRGALVQVHGAEAARRLELTTQVPTQPVFSTSGHSKRIRVGKTEIRLQHVCPRKLALAGRPAGLALAALWYLGKHEVTVGVIEKIRRNLPETEFEALKSTIGSMPGWMSDVFIRYSLILIPKEVLYVGEIDRDFLKRLASKYIWWQIPDEAVAMPKRVIAQVMDIGDYADVQALASQVGDEVLRDVLTHAEIGQFSERSWAYWHYRLGLAGVGNVPPMPSRRLA